MSAVASKPLHSRSSLLRPIALGGAFIFIVQLIHMWITATLIQKTPYTLALQYMASGAIGDAAFTGGAATALLGALFHLIVAFVVAAVFVLSFERIPFLRQYPIPGSLLYGLGVYIVMNFIVLPLSAAPPLPVPTIPWLIEAALEHILLIGLPLGLLLRRQ